MVPPVTQLAFVEVVPAVSAATGWLITALAVALQLLLSVTVTVYMPDTSPLRFWVVIPPPQL